MLSFEFVGLEVVTGGQVEDVGFGIVTRLDQMSPGGGNGSQDGVQTEGCADALQEIFGVNRIFGAVPDAASVDR